LQRGKSDSSKTKLISRHAIHIQSFHYHAHTRPLESLDAHAAPPTLASYPITLAQTVSLQYPHAVNDVRKNGRVDINVLGHVMRDHVHLVMKRWLGLVDVERVSWWWGVMC
jgi:hypothetical protein